MKRKNKLKLKDHQALVYLLAAVAAGGRAFLGVPTEVTAADVSLTMLWMVALLLLGLARRSILPALPTVAMVAVELYLCGAGGGAPLVWAALRAADLALLALCSLLAARAACALMADAAYTRQVRWMLAAQGVLWLALAALLPACALLPGQAQLATARSAAFLLYSAAQLWFVVLAVRAYRRAMAAR